MKSIFSISADLLFNLCNFLEEELLTINSSLLNLRFVNKQFYDLVNYFWGTKYSIKQIKCLDHNTYVLLVNGDLYACGKNGAHMDLGLPVDLAYSNQFIKVKQNVKSIIDGNSSMIIILTNDNKYYGKGNSHHLGLNAIASKVTFIDGAGQSFNIVTSLTYKNIFPEGRIYYDSGSFWRPSPKVTEFRGKNFSYSYINEFTAMPVDLDLQRVCLGAEHVVLLDRQGSVYVCGCNQYGQLGTGNHNNSDVFVKIFENADQILTAKFNTFIRSQGVWYGCGLSFIYRKEIPDLILVPQPIKYFSKLPSLKTIISKSEDPVLWLDENGDFYIINSDNTELLIENDVLDLGILDYSQKSLLLLKNNGSLFYFGDLWSDELFNKFLHNSSISWKERLKNTILNAIGSNLITYLPYNLGTYLLLPLCSQIITNDVEQISSSASLEFNHHTNELRDVKSLLFTKNQGKNLYAFGLNCNQGQLGLSAREQQQMDLNNNFTEVVDHLPTVQNKLLRGKALLPI